MIAGELFAGIGGIGLGFEAAGIPTVWRCEIDPFCRAVLERRYPGVPIVADAADVGAALASGRICRVDVLAGGFPCQPVSQAGRQLAQADPRWLWPTFARAIRALGPRYVVVENVPGLLARGMGDVLGELAAQGFDAEWCVFSARDAGAPHLRERVWVLAWRRADAHRQRRPRLAQPAELEAGGQPTPLRGDVDGLRPAVADAQGVGRGAGSDGQQTLEPGERRRADAAGGGVDRGSRAVAHADVQRLQADPATGRAHRVGSAPVGRHSGGTGRPFDAWPAEPAVGRMANGVPDQVDRLRALGNAVVPRCAEHVARYLLSLEAAGVGAPTSDAHAILT